MAIQVVCSCGRTCNFPDPQAGQKARCMYCGLLIDVPAIDSPAAASPQLHAPVSLEAPVDPATAAAELNLEMAQPSQHVSGPVHQPRTAPGGGGRPVEPVRQVAPGLGAGRIVFWSVIAAVGAVVVFGIYSLVHWMNMSEYESLIHGGHDWLAKGYLTDAEIHFKKAKAIFPNDARTTEAFQKLAQAQEDKKRNPRPVNAILGPIAAPGMIPPDAQQRLMQAQQMAGQAQALQQMRQREMEQRVREEQGGPPVSAQILEAKRKRDEAIRKAEEARKKAEAVIASTLNQPVPTKQEAEQQSTSPTPNTQVAEPEPAVKPVQDVTDTRASRREEQRQKAEEARKAAQAELAKRQELVLLGRLTTWSTNVTQECGQYAAAADWANSRDLDRLAVAAKQAINDPTNEDVKIQPAEILQKIGDIQDGDGLSEFHKSLPKLIQQVGEAEAAARGAKAIARTQILTTLRSYDQIVQQEAQIKNQYTNEAAKKRQQLTADRLKLTEKLTEQSQAFVKGLNDCRFAKAGKLLLEEARKLAAARIQTLGGDLGTPAGAPETAAPPVKLKVYVLKDGTEIKAVTVASMGDQFLIKDDAGKMHTIEKGDVKEVK